VVVGHAAGKELEQVLRLLVVRGGARRGLAEGGGVVAGKVAGHERLQVGGHFLRGGLGVAEDDCLLPLREHLFQLGLEALRGVLGDLAAKLHLDGPVLGGPEDERDSEPGSEVLGVGDHRREGADGRGPLPRLEPDEQGFQGRAAAFVGEEVDLVDDHAPEAQARRGEEGREALEGRDEYVGVRSTSAIAATR